MVRRPFILDGRQSTARGLVGLWGPGPSGGGTLFDMSGRGNHGTVGSEVTWPASTRGIVTGFSGNDNANNAVALGNPDILKITGALSVSIWFRLANLTAHRTLAVKGRTFGTSAQYDWGLAFNDSADTINWRGSGGGAHLWNINSAAVAAGEWIHAVGTWDGTTAANGVNLYINGEVSVQGTSGGVTLTTTHDLFLGRAERYPHNELIGGGRIYNRALSAAEVQRIYQKTWADPYSDIAMPPRRVFKAPAAAGVAPTSHLYGPLVGPLGGAV